MLPRRGPGRRARRATAPSWPGCTRLTRSYRTYGTGSRAFARFFTACGESWPRMLKAAATLASSDFSRPQHDDFEAVIDRLSRDGCGDPARARVASSL